MNFSWKLSMLPLREQQISRYSHQESIKETQIIAIPGDFPGGAVVRNLPVNAGGTGSSPGLGRSHMPRSN